MDHFTDHKLDDEIFKRISDLVYKNFGINLTDQKKALVKGRLQKLVREGGFGDYKSYFDHVMSDPTGRALSGMLDRITTNYTFFMREKDHFDFFASHSLKWAQELQESRNNRDIRVWCAGCSSGEEPYTLAMIMLDHFGTAATSWDLGILATDISANVLDTAILGQYPLESIREVPDRWRKKYFRGLRDAENVEVAESLKDLILFRRFNLMRQQYPFKGKFHVIFCRNVMIYFDAPTKARIINKFHDFLEPGGYLFVGHSESLDRGRTPFEYVKPAVYRKRP